MVPGKVTLVKSQSITVLQLIKWQYRYRSLYCWADHADCRMPTIRLGLDSSYCVILVAMTVAVK